MTDFSGCSIYHSHPSKNSTTSSSSTSNIYGVVATGGGVSHNEIVNQIKSLSEVIALFSSSGLVEENDGGSSAIDVCRDIYGRAIDILSLSNLIGTEVVSYQCPEQETHRYLMSHAARLYLTYSDDKGDVSHRPASIFYKRAVMR